MAKDKKQHSRKDWVDAAKVIFIQAGIEQVKVDVIAKKMGITRGSFYWHFDNRGELLDALLEDWLTRNRSAISDIEKSWFDHDPTLRDCIRMWLQIEEETLTFDMSIRLWARSSEEVSAALLEVDNAWIALLTRLFLSSGETEAMADARARVVYFHQIGYHTLNLRESMEERLKRVPLYNAILTGDDADKSEALMSSIGGSHSP